jgi:hypothetical protein
MTVELRLIRNDAPIRASRLAPERADRVLPTIVHPILEPLDTVVAHSIEELDRREWDSLFARELEDWSYLHALERAQLAACESVYFGVRSRGRLVAAVPGFVGRRALGEPGRSRARAQWRSAPDRALVLGSPVAAACRFGVVPHANAADQALLVESLLRAARAEAARRGLGELLASGDDAARITVPRWSLADYLSSFDEGLRRRLLHVCAQAALCERDWRARLGGDIEPMLGLCRDAGLDEINGAFFEGVLGLDTVSASCLLVRVDGGLVGFSLVLHDSRVLREQITVISRRDKDAFVRGVIWLETLRYCLEHGIGAFESASELSLCAARPDELRKPQHPSTGRGATATRTRTAHCPRRS